MAKPGKPIPEGFRTITPHLNVAGAAAAIEFYKKAFGAEEIQRMPGPGGKVMHAEIRIGDSMVMLADEYPEFGNKAPTTLGGSPVTIHLYSNDVDALWDRAIKAGAKEVMPLMDAFWGDRYGQVVDPFGHKWGLGMHLEDLTPEEIGERAKQAGF
ncbi:MAG: VOC family protein [Candidatus Polarisedimenticolia bacterium]